MDWLVRLPGACAAPNGSQPAGGEVFGLQSSQVKSYPHSSKLSYDPFASRICISPLIPVQDYWPQLDTFP